MPIRTEKKNRRLLGGNFRKDELLSLDKFYKNASQNIF